MEEKKDKPAEQETTSEATVERGKKAIEADKKLNKKDKDVHEVEKEQQSDAEQWRNEG